MGAVMQNSSLVYDSEEHWTLDLHLSFASEQPHRESKGVPIICPNFFHS